MHHLRAVSKSIGLVLCLLPTQMFGSIWPETEYEAQLDLQLASINSEIAPTVVATWQRRTVNGWGLGLFAAGLAMSTKGLSETSNHSSLKTMSFGFKVSFPLFSKFFGSLAYGNSSVSYEQVAEEQLDPDNVRNEQISLSGSMLNVHVEYDQVWSEEKSILFGLGINSYAFTDSLDKSGKSRNESASMSQPYVSIGWRQEILH